MASRTTLDLAAILADALSTSPPGRPAPGGSILDAARDLLARYGLRRWSMEDVAAAAGVGRATLYRRYPTRDELVAAVLAREAKTFFGAVAEAVEHLPTLEDKLVEGFSVGLRLAESSLLSDLLRHDPGAGLSVLARPGLDAGRSALIERFEALTGTRLTGRRRARAEAVAETLLRLGLSYLIVPAVDPEGAIAEMRSVVAALASPAGAA